MHRQTVSTMDTQRESKSSLFLAGFTIFSLHYRLLIDRDDSINGSKTQSSATTESNTPENTVRLENMGQKAVPNFHIENNEVVLESESPSPLNDGIDYLNFYCVSRGSSRK